MNDQNRDFDDRVRRLVRDAVSDAPDPPLPPEALDVAAPTMTQGRSRWLAVATISAAVVATVTVLVVVGSDPDTTVQQIESPATLESPVTITSLDSISPSIESTTTDVTESVTAEVDRSDTAPAVAADIARPLAAPTQCESVAARDGFIEGLSFIGHTSNTPIPLALFADPTTQISPQFVVIHRFFDDRSVQGDEFIDLDDTTYGITFLPDGDQEITWRLEDSLGYARARGLSRDELIALVTALEPRPADATIPGFEYRPTDPSAQLELIQEINDTDVVGTVARSVCISDTANRYRVTALNGDAVFVYSAILDRPIPLDIAVSGDTTIVINGPAGADAPHAVDVINSNTPQWQTLLEQPEHPTHQATIQGGAAGTDTTAELVSLDGTTEPSELTLRITTTDGISFLEVDKRGTDLDKDAAYWTTEVDGRLRSANTAFPGGFGGTRLGDLTDRTEPIIVRVSVIDGGDFVLQTTGRIELPPPTS